MSCDSPGNDRLRTIGRARPTQAHKPWTDDALRELWLLKLQGVSIEEIAELIGRDRRAVTQVWGRRLKWKDRVTVTPPEPTRDFTPRTACVTMEDIRRAVCGVYGIGKATFTSSSRQKNACEARQVFCWISHRFTTRSFHQMAEYAGHKDHSTAAHGVEKITEQFDTFRDKVELSLFDLGLDLAGAKERAA